MSLSFTGWRMQYDFSTNGSRFLPPGEPRSGQGLPEHHTLAEDVMVPLCEPRNTTQAVWTWQNICHQYHCGTLGHAVLFSIWWLVSKWFEVGCLEVNHWAFYHLLVLKLLVSAVTIRPPRFQYHPWKMVHRWMQTVNIRSKHYRTFPTSIFITVEHTSIFRRKCFYIMVVVTLGHVSWIGGRDVFCNNKDKLGLYVVLRLFSGHLHRSLFLH